jgi:hypothetical protein
MASTNDGHYSMRLVGDSFEQNHAVNDFVEYKRDNFFVTVLETDYFCLVERNIEGGLFGSSSKLTKIRSMNGGVLSLGIELVPGPRLDKNSFALVRDRRGVQLVNLLKATSHQLMLSPVPVEYTDLDFLKLVYDEKSHQTNVVTISYESYPDSIKSKLDSSGQADREGNKPVLSMYGFNREFQSGLISLLQNSVSERTLY